MTSNAAGGSTRFPEMGLQFNPTQHVGGADQTQSVNPPTPTTPVDESQEVLFENSGQAILLGDEKDPESNSNDVTHQSTPVQYQPKGGWLRSSSPKIKAFLGMTAIAVLAFVAVMIVGVVQLSPQDNKNDDGFSSAQTDENIATDPETTTPPPPQPASTPDPSPAPTTFSPSPETMHIPISESEVNALFPLYLEMKVPDFSDGLSAAEEENWYLIESTLEGTISTSLSDSLPENYSVESTQVDEFDGYVTSSIRRRKRRNRNLQNESGKIHSVLYSSSIKVNCLETDCSEAENTVANAASNLAGMEYIQVTASTDAPISSTTPVPTKRPSVSTSAPNIPATPQPTEGTSTPTSLRPTLRPSTAPVEAAAVLLPLSNGACSQIAPCDRCFGSCIEDAECGVGLLCFHRRGYDFVPGCVGPGLPAQSYCYDPFVDGLTVNELLSIKDNNCDKKDRCVKCSGDCDEDEDCDKNLICFKRTGFEPVPGCAGQGTFGTDYCFNPDDIETGDY